MAGRYTDQVLIYPYGKVYHWPRDEAPGPAPWRAGRGSARVTRFIAVQGYKLSACRRCWPEQEQEG